MSITVERLVAEIEADPSGAVAALTTFDAFLSGVTRDRSSDLDVDAGSALSSLVLFDSQADVATRDRTVNIDVDRNGINSMFDLSRAGASATQAVSGLGQAAASAVGGGGGGVGALGSAASGAAGGFQTLGGSLAGMMGPLLGMVAGGAALVAIISILPGVFASAAAGAGVLLAALAPLVGLLGALPVGLALVGGGMVALGAVALPVLSAFTAMGAVQDQAAQSSTALAGRQRELAAAQRGLREATIGVARAERELADARRNLAEAPEEAREALEDQRYATRQAILSEAQAVMRLKEAQESLARAQNSVADAGKTLTTQTDEFTGKIYDVAYASADAQKNAMDERAARLALRQAELDLAQARDNSEDSQRELNEMERKGIKGSDVMVAARRRLVDAEFALARSHEAVAAAQDRIAESQQRLAQGTADQTAATRNLNEAMAALTPTGRNFVRFLYDDFVPGLKDAFKPVQDAVLPGIQDGLESMMTMFDEMGEGTAELGETMGDAFADFWAHWAKDKNMARLTDMWTALNKTMGKVLKIATPLSDVLVDITTAAAPMVDMIAVDMRKGLRNFSDWMQTDNGKKQTADFFEDAAHFGGLWLDVIKPIGGIFKAISRAAKPLAEKWLVKMAESLEETSEWLNSEAGQDTILDYIERQIPTLKELWAVLGDISDILFGTSEGGEESAFYKFLHSLRTDLLPEIKTMMEGLEESDIAADLVESLGGIATALNEIDWAEIEDGIGTISDFLDNPGKSTIEGIFKGISREITGIVTFPMSKEFKESFKEIGAAWEEHVQEPIRDFLGIEDGEGFGKIGANLTGFMDRQWEKIKTSFMEEFIDPIKRQFGIIKDSFINQFIDPIVRQFTKIKNSFMNDFVQPIKDEVGDFKDWVIEEIITPLQEAWDVLDFSLPDLNPGEGKGIDLTPWEGLIPGNWSGGPVEADKPTIVGEHGPELFNPSTSGRIMPYGPTKSLMESTSGGITDEQLERVLRAVLDEGQKKVEINQTFNEKVDPHHLSRELAWSLS